MDISMTIAAKGFEEYLEKRAAESGGGFLSGIADWWRGLKPEYQTGLLGTLLGGVGGGLLGGWKGGLGGALAGGGLGYAGQRYWPQISKWLGLDSADPQVSVKDKLKAELAARTNKDILSGARSRMPELGSRFPTGAFG